MGNLFRYHFVVPEQYRNEDTRDFVYLIEANSYSAASEMLARKTPLHSFCTIEKVERYCDGVWFLLEK